MTGSDKKEDRPGNQSPRKLGRGLGALMGELQKPETNDAGNDEQAHSGGDQLRSIPLAGISPLPGQPRTHFDESALAELAESIRAKGVIQPVIVTETAPGQYQLVAGERRWRAAQKAQLHEIPAIVRDLEKREIMALALIENLQREDLNPVEEARAYRRLADEEDLTQAEIAGIVNKSRSHVANLQRMLELPDEVLDLVSSEELSMGHARALIGNIQAAELARKAVAEQLSVREVEKLARGDQKSRRKTGNVPSQKLVDGNADLMAMQGQLEDFLGMAVRIETKGDAAEGIVSIRYKTLDQLDLICQRLTGGDI